MPLFLDDPGDDVDKISEEPRRSGGPLPPSHWRRAEFDTTDEALPPRTWSMPTFPADVTAVRDREGDVWRREGRRWVFAVCRLDDEALLSEFGPLTEVTDA